MIKSVVLALAMVLITGACNESKSTPSQATDVVQSEPARPQIPPDAETPGQRNPLVGALAIVGIILTLVAGIYVYRIIRKGL